jgi:two-component system chemotaxis response regulator CheB
VDVLFHSVAQEFGLTGVGVLMTGMGEDGAAGLGAIKSAGGMTIAQSEESCVVSGMPRAAIAKGYANRIVPLDGLAAYLASQYGSERTNSEKKEKDKLEKAEIISVSHRN